MADETDETKLRAALMIIGHLGDGAPKHQYEWARIGRNAIGIARNVMGPWRDQVRAERGTAPQQPPQVANMLPPVIRPELQLDDEYTRTDNQPSPPAELVEKATETKAHNYWQNVFKNAECFERWADCNSFWENMPYGTRFYFGDGASDYIQRGILRSAVKQLNLAKPMKGTPK